MISIRASSLPIIAKCPAAAVAPSVVIDNAGSEANLGSAVHEALATIVLGNEPDLDAIEAKWQCDDQELSILTAMGRKCWEQLSQWFPSPFVERPFQHSANELTISGTTDLVSLIPEESTLRILDWKSGRLDSESEPQLRAYCWLALQWYPEIDKARAVVVRIRDQAADWFPEWTRAELDSWFAGIRESLRNTDRYNPGSWCGYCKRLHECPGRAAYVRQAGDAMLYLDQWTPPTDLAELGVSLGKMHDRMKMIRQACDMADDIIRSEVIANGGRLPVGDGRELVMSSTEQMKLKPSAFPAIRDEIGETAALECCTLSKTKAEAAIKAKTPRGQKQQAVDAMMGRLEAIGAVDRITVKKLEMRRSPLTLEKHS